MGRPRTFREGFRHTLSTEMGRMKDSLGTSWLRRRFSNLAAYCNHLGTLKRTPDACVPGM